MGSPIFPPSSGGSGSGTSDHSQLTNRTAANQHPGSSISLDTAGFDNNLSSADDTVQKAMATIDEMSGGGTGITWNNVTGTSQTAAVNNGYIANNASLCTITMPSTAAVGSLIRIAGSGAGGWKLAQNSGQQVMFGDQYTTAGTSGSLSSSNQYDAIELLCIVANTTFVVIGSMGNITVV